MLMLEYFIDIVLAVDIMLTFLKWKIQTPTLEKIAIEYLQSYFIFDLVPILVCLSSQESIHVYIFKCFRILRLSQISLPLRLLLEYLLANLPKKRQRDLMDFFVLIFFVVYLNHIMACIWLQLGNMYDCSTLNKDGCKDSWIFDGKQPNRFADSGRESQYIFAFYWIFEVITTVGYGDYFGKTSEEHLYSILVQFVGLVFFSLLMGHITQFFNTSDNFEDQIDEKLDQLDMWIKKIEKSNHPFFIQPYLYHEIKMFIDMAYRFDYNLVVEEYPFFYQLTPKLQSELISQTDAF